MTVGPQAAIVRACCAFLGLVLLALLLVGGPAVARASAIPADQLDQPGIIVDPSAGPLPPRGAATFVVADADTGAVLAASGAHVQRPPASTLKMLTLLTLLPRLDPRERHTATEAEAGVIGSKVGIVAGSTYSIQNLLEGMILQSGNDTAAALANANGGEVLTVAQMNAEARRVGADMTVARNPHGLDDPAQLSTAYDLALIAREGLRHQRFRELVGLRTSMFPGPGQDKDRWSFVIDNQNTVVTGAFEGGIGVKSGFTSQAGRTFATAATREGKTYLVSLMGIVGNTYRTGAEFLEWAFANGSRIEPVGQLRPTRFEQLPVDAATLVADPFDEVAYLAAVERAEALAPGNGSRIALVLVLVLGVVAAVVVFLRRRRTVAASLQRPVKSPAYSATSHMMSGETSSKAERTASMV